MSEEDFNVMGCDIDFKTFRVLQTLNKMCNEDIAEETDESNESLWFLGVEKRNVMRCMLRDKKVATIPSGTGGQDVKKCCTNDVVQGLPTQTKGTCSLCEVTGNCQC